MRSALIGSSRNRLLRFALCAAAGLLLPLAARAHEPREWIPFSNQCPPPGDTTPGAYVDCWNPHTRFAGVVNDLSKEAGAVDDTSHSSEPSPPSVDLVSGASQTLPTFWYGFKNAAVLHPTYGTPGPNEPLTRPMVYMAMRLDATPLLTNVNQPGLDVNGPFQPNSAWNFIWDFNGDGWSDIIASVAGGSGVNQQNPYDDHVLGYNPETDSQRFGEFAGPQGAETRLCGQVNPRGDVLNFHDSNRFGGSPIEGCFNAATDADCDFGITRVIRVDTDGTSGNADFILMMQMPLAWFDDCHTVDADGDGIGGDQLLDPEKPFSMCVTTSTQSSDYTGKDIAYNGTFKMDVNKPVICSDSCTLANGCQQQPVLAETTLTCSQSTNVIDISLEVLDTLDATGGQISDTIASVVLQVSQDGSNVWTTIGNATRDPVSLSTWELIWDFSAVPTTPSSLYHVRAIITDDQSNVTDIAPVAIDLNTCTVQTTPVTLASFRAVRDGSLVRFEWTTETELGNLGFNILRRDAEGQWVPVNDQLIRAKGIDSVEPNAYTFEAFGVEGEVFAIEDVDIRGRATRRGPIEPRGERLRATISAHSHHAGAHVPALEARAESATVAKAGAPPQVEEIDWAGIRAARTRAAAMRPRTAAAKGGGNASSPAAEILVDRDGLYRVSYEELVAAGTDFAGASAQHLALMNQGAAVPIRVVSGKSFGAGSWIEFRGQPVASLYTSTNVYQLRVEPKNARRISESTAGATGAAAGYYLATVEHERDRAYSFTAPGNDPWYDGELVAVGGPAALTFEVSADQLVSGAGGATLALDVWGVTSWAKTPDHHVRVLVNGNPVAEATFDGQAAQRIVAALPEGSIHEGVNQVRVELPNDLGFPWDVVYVDGFTLTYPRAFRAQADGLRFTAAGSAFEVRGLGGSTADVWRLDATPVRLKPTLTSDADGLVARFAGTGGSASYVVATSFLSPQVRPVRPAADLLSGPADYLVISHGDFLEALQPLVTLRQNEGHDVKVVDVEDVYAQYGNGIFGAEAIRSYVRAAAPALGVRYLLLVGGDTYDYADRLGLGSISFVPSPYAATGDIVNHAPVDPLYGDLDGDNVPELAVGRLPARTAAQLTTLIGKIQAHRDGDHHGTAVFAADVWDMAYEVSYSELSERMISSLPAGWSVERAYLESGVAQAKARLLDSVNSGVALTSWMGHSGFTIWSMNRVFSANEASLLTNYGRPTIVSQWGCWNNYHVSPRYETLGHKLLLSGDQGAAAVLGSATLSEVESQALLSRMVTPLLTQPGKTIGDAMVEAKRRLAVTDPARLDVLLGWTLLGDPAMQVQP